MRGETMHVTESFLPFFPYDVLPRTLIGLTRSWSAERLKDYFYRNEGNLDRKWRTEKIYWNVHFFHFSVSYKTGKSMRSKMDSWTLFWIRGISKPYHMRPSKISSIKACLTQARHPTPLKNEAPSISDVMSKIRAKYLSYKLSTDGSENG